MATFDGERSSMKYSDQRDRGCSRESLAPDNGSGYISLLPSGKPTQSKKCPPTWNIIVIVLFVLALFISGLLIGYFVRHFSDGDTSKKQERICLKPPRKSKDGPRHLELLHENLMYTMNGDKQAAYLRNYAAKQVYSSSEYDVRLTRLLRAYFDKFGFDSLHEKKINEKYDVLLSLPDKDRPNEVHLLSSSGELLFSDPTLKLPESSPDGIEGFVDSAPDGGISVKESQPEVAGGGGKTTSAPVLPSTTIPIRRTAPGSTTVPPFTRGPTSRMGPPSTTGLPSTAGPPSTTGPPSTMSSTTSTTGPLSTSAENQSETAGPSRRRRGVGSTSDETFDDELLDLNDDSITPELIERLKKLGSEPLPIPIPDLPPFVAYSPPGEVTAELIYVGYGGPEEYGTLQKEELVMRGRIALVRLGNQTIREKVRQAEGRGLVGLLIYMDPADDFLTPFKGCNDSVAFWANANDDHKGDPLTPDYPSVDGIVRVDMKESSTPKIPVQTVSCAFAQRLLASMTGLEAPSSWAGGLNLTYYAGRKSTEGTPPFLVKLSVHNKYLRAPIYNVIATLTGEEEPDKYVIVGANRNSFGLGPFGGIFGTAGLVELARNLGILINREKWRPKRTILLCSWGGGDFGNIGIMEHLQEYGTALKGRIVTYINLDQPILGNYSLRVASSPTLHNIIYNAAERVPSPDDKQSMLFDTWLDHSVETDDDFQPHVFDPTDPRLMTLPDPFFSELGVPSTHIQYMPRNNKAFDIALIPNEIRHHWRYHSTVNRMSGLLALSLVDSSIVQYDLERMARKLQTKVTDWLVNNDVVQNDTANGLITACEELVKATGALRYFILHQADFDVPTEKILINERLINCENIMAKAFFHIEVLRIKLLVVQKLTASGEDQKAAKAEYDRQLAELLARRRQLAAERAKLMKQLPETREKQQRVRELLRQQQDLAKPIRHLREELFKIEQQQLSIQILSVTIFAQSDFSELLQTLRSAKQMLRVEL